MLLHRKTGALGLRDLSKAASAAAAHASSLTSSRDHHHGSQLKVIEHSEHPDKLQSVGSRHSVAQQNHFIGLVSTEPFENTSTVLGMITFRLVSKIAFESMPNLPT